MDAGRADGGQVDGGSATASPEVARLVEQVQTFYERTSDFSARFEQVYRYKMFRRTQRSSGTVKFKKPGLMRWDYEQPSPRAFVLSGESAYAYDPGAKTLTKASIGTNQLSVSVTFLFGRGKLTDEFVVTRLSCKDCKGPLLELTPKTPDPRFQRLMLELDPKTSHVVRSTVVDPDGSENVIHFQDLVTNTGLQASAFKLAPAPGTQMLDLTRKSQETPPR